jgi:hypothetical protein
MVLTDEEIDTRNKLFYAAESTLLQNIVNNDVSAAAIRDYAEAFALLTGKLTAKPVTIKNG